MKVNFLVASKYARGTEGIIDASQLRNLIEKHDGSEAYHCAFDLEKESLKVEEDTGTVNEKGEKLYRYHAQTPETLARYPLTTKGYRGNAAGALGYAWFDFDDAENPQRSLDDARKFLERIGSPAHFLAYFSGGKGFHVGIPNNYFDYEPARFAQQLHGAAQTLRKELPTLDPSVFNPNRKFRLPGSRHPKTGLFKVLCALDSEIGAIISAARERRNFLVPEPPENCGKLAVFKELGAPYSSEATESISLKEWQRYKRPSGERARQECLFLKRCENNPAAVTEPEWYAMAGIVGRFQDGRAQFHAMSKGHPGYSASEADSKLEYALQSSGPRTCKAINMLWSGCSGCKHFEKIKSPVVILEKDTIPTEATGFYTMEMDASGNEKYYPNYNDLQRAFKRDQKYLVDPYLDRTYGFSETHYDVITPTHINAWVEEVMDPKPKTNVVNEARSKILRNEVKSASFLESLFFASTEGKLNLKNGVLDIRSGEMMPHDETLGFRYVLPYDFIESARAPTFEKFLDDVTLQRSDLKRTLLEFMGYCLWPSYDDHCFLWLSGTGRNGKSTFLEILQALCGEYNSTNVQLAQFEKSNYLQMLDHKLVNISEEADENKILPTVMANLKALSSGARVQVDQKYEVGYAMRSRAKLVFASNKPPLLPGSETAIKSRMIVVPFDLQLEEHAENAVQSKVDWELLGKMKAELPGILNLALSALRDFVRRTPRKIHRSTVSQEMMNEYMRDSDPVEAWVQDYLTILPDPHGGPGYTLEALYDAFKRVADNPEKVMDQHWFARRLRSKLGPKVVVLRSQIQNKRSRVFKGITLDFKPEF